MPGWREALGTKDTSEVEREGTLHESSVQPGNDKQEVITKERQEQGDTPGLFLWELDRGASLESARTTGP